MDNKLEEQLGRDLKIEKEYLEYIISKINCEMNSYIDKRKDISNTIVEYRKKFIEEYRDDDDKVIEYFDHENHKNEFVFMIIEKKLKEMIKLKNSPYFGKIQIDDYGSVENFYIGSYGFDIGGEMPLIIDWRAPIASLFYQGKIGNLSYNVSTGEAIQVNILKRRQFVIKNSKIYSIFDSEIDIKDEFLKEMLSLKASNKLKNIVQTIQKTQDFLIRVEKNKALIINGIAGSGKTSIALHRVAYLLYNFRNYFKDKVLILGPNKIFMEYISSVLPSLGEDGGAYNSTSEDFIYSLINEDLNVISFSYHMEKCLNDEEYLNEFKFKASENMKIKLDEFIIYVETNTKFGMDIYFKDELVITYDEMYRFFYESFKSRVLEVRINLLRKRIIEKINKIRNKLVYDVVNKYNSLDDQDGELYNHYDMLKRNEIQDIVMEAMLIKSSLSHLKLESPYELYKEFYEEYFCKELDILDFNDLVAIVYLKLKAFDFKKIKDFKLVVIDEAQDFSYMFFNIIKEYTKASSYIIVGDINQKILDYGNTFLEDTNIFDNREEYSLKDSYRSTKEIVDYSKEFLNENIDVNSIRSGSNVDVINCSEDELNKILINRIKKYSDLKYENIGILVKDKIELNKVYEYIKNIGYIKLIDNEDHIYSSNGVFLTTVYFSKGLEFDCVIVIDNNLDNNLKYIMLTRGMHELTHIKIKM